MLELHEGLPGQGHTNNPGYLLLWSVCRLFFHPVDPGSIRLFVFAALHCAGAITLVSHRHVSSVASCSWRTELY